MSQALGLVAQVEGKVQESMRPETGLREFAWGGQSAALVRGLSAGTKLGLGSWGQEE